MKLINIRNLVIMDMALHGRKFILIEFIGAVIIAFAIGGYIIGRALLKGHGLWVGIAISGIGFNYLPLAIYAIQFKKDQPFDQKMLTMESKRRYTLQSFLLFIPFAVFMIAFFQSVKKQGTSD